MKLPARSIYSNIQFFQDLSTALRNDDKLVTTDTALAPKPFFSFVRQILFGENIRDIFLCYKATLFVCRGGL